MQSRIGADQGPIRACLQGIHARDIGRRVAVILRGTGRNSSSEERATKLEWCNDIRYYGYIIDIDIGANLQEHGLHRILREYRGNLCSVHFECIVTRILYENR